MKARLLLILLSASLLAGCAALADGLKDGASSKRLYADAERSKY